MSAKKNTSLAIGAFIVGAIVLVFVALLFFSGGRFFADKERIIMYFEGSVQGLQVGAPVKLKGVVLGEIIDIQINFQDDNKTVVTAVKADLVMKRINSEGVNVGSDFLNESVTHGLRAQLNYQSFLTGLLYVELDFFPESELKLYNLQRDYPEIPTRGTSFEEISKSFQELDLKGLVNNFNSLTEQISSMVGNGEISEALNSFSRMATSIEKTSTTVDKQMTQLGNSLHTTLADLDSLVKDLRTQTPLIAESLNKSLAELNESLKNFDAAAASVNHTFSEDAPLMNQLATTLEDISRSAQAFRDLSETLEQQPESILRGRSLAPNED